MVRQCHLTSETLRAEIDTAVLRAGGLPANTIVAGGDQACDPHERGHGPLKANSLIIHRYFSTLGQDRLLWRPNENRLARTGER